MKSIIIALLILIIVFILASEPQLTLKPFKLKFNNLASSLGWVFMVIGINLLLASERSKNYRKGIDKGVNLSIEVMKEEFKNK